MSGPEKADNVHVSTEIPDQIGRILLDAVKNHDKPSRAEANKIRSNVRDQLDTIYANATFEEEPDESSKTAAPVEWPAPRTTVHVHITGKNDPLVYECDRQYDDEVTSYPPDPNWGAPGPAPRIPKPEFIVLTDEAQESYFLPLRAGISGQ
jgi:hypothetical protein